MAHNSSNYSQRGTPASSQIIFLEDKVKELEEKNRQLEKENRLLKKIYKAAVIASPYVDPESKWKILKIAIEKYRNIQKEKKGENGDVQP